MDAIIRFLQDTGFYLFSQDGNWRCLIMLGIACVLLYLGIVKKFEPLLLVPIAFGMLITNLPGANMFHEIFFAGGHIHWDLIGGQPVTAVAAGGPPQSGRGRKRAGPLHPAVDDRRPDHLLPGDGGTGHRRRHGGGRSRHYRSGSAASGAGAGGAGRCLLRHDPL